MVDICALSTVHYAYDSRIYHKQARSLAAAGFRVTVVARAETDAPPDDTVEIRPVASHRFRLTRFLGALLMIGRALRVRARIYVIHDPALLPLGLTLKLLGRGRKITEIINANKLLACTNREQDFCSARR